MNDRVNHPKHYTCGKVECIDAIEAATVNLSGIDAVCTANVIKYVWRWRQKNGVEDLKKARWYLDRLIANREAEIQKIADDLGPLCPSFLDAYDQVEAYHMGRLDPNG